MPLSTSKSSLRSPNLPQSHPLLQLWQAGRPDHAEGRDLHEGVRQRELAGLGGRPGLNFLDKGVFRQHHHGQDERREESITGVVVGDRECELTDPLGNV